MHNWREDCRPSQAAGWRSAVQRRVFTWLTLLCLIVPLLTPVLVRAQSQAGISLRLNGTNTYVSIAHDPALNAFPLTITAWVKTLRNTALVDGIVGKYQDSSFNGYSLNLRNGNLYAWYLRGGGSIVVNPFGLDGGFIADGHWHEIAFVVSATAGLLYVDGNLKNSVSWTGTPGPPTGTEPLLIGQYYTNTVYQNTFQGEIDEVTLWKRALAASEVNYLKHRRLAGNEDGLLGYWRFDEGSGTVVNNSATNAFHGINVNAAAWVQSHAAIALQPVATNCLRFDGATGYVQAAHNTDLNAYPFTASGWFRTTNAVSTVQGVVSKYADGSGNGWSIMVQNGRLRGFYYRPGFIPAIDATSVANVADGGWHHAALTVDAAGGKLWLDGTVVGSGAWATPGACNNTEPLLMGCYTPAIYPQRFQGALDEITVWNRALTTNEIQTMRNLPLTGSESNLVAYWRMDEGAGTTTADATGLGHTGTLTNSPAWVGSTAYLGDGSVHLIAAPSVPSFTRQYAISTAVGIIPALGQNRFQVTGRAFLRRFYDFGLLPPSIPLVSVLNGGLQLAGAGAAIPIKPAAVTNGFSMSAYNASTPQPLTSGSIASLNSTINLEPDSVQLDSVNNLYEAVETLTHNENGGTFSNDGIDVTDPARLLHFNGHVFFGNIEAVVTNIINTPTSGTITAPTHLASQLQIAAGGAYLAAAPGFKFGGGVAFNVNLGANGFATNLNGSFSLANPTQFFEANGIRYRLPGAALSAAGMLANLEAWFPAGFGMSITTNTRIMLPFAAKTNLTLGPDLLPTITPIVFTAAAYNTNRLYFSEETKPVLIGASQIVWRIPEGEFFIPEAQSLQFVRQKEDDDLAAQRTNLVSQISADRVSNDGYYRNIAPVAGVPLYVRPATNGSALLSMSAQLGASEYRPHFPYMNRNLGGSIPVLGGTYTVTDDLIDGASYLVLGGAVPVPYARDCGLDSCSGAPTIGAQVLNFTTSLGQLNFTPEGGLLASGSIPAANLTWGYAGGTDYAQRTSDVTTGDYYISGTFLRAAEFSDEQDARRPVRMLHTGYGNGSDATYVERPLQANYADGFANYAGLNFRAPAQGRSFMRHETGWYPLTARARYYARYGGVSGIHESASFPANMRLYNYFFSFQSYRLSFLSSDNEDSRTDGVISLPVPSGFPVEFERMKFLCRGNLDSARLPANIAAKHLVYWNTDLNLLTLQFKPKTGGACSLTERYLVLGVETKLPFIPQAFQAALAIKANGNLATALTQVEGVDSRFAIPANLQLQGPGGSFYPITTAGDGYFNNWETPGRPEFGFYSLAGRIRVPFFRDIKTHFHVTPTGPNTSQLDLMGGWTSEEGVGENRGWNNGTQNYFSTPRFDPNADGWPVALVPNIANYRKSPDAGYRLRAQRNWIDVAIFDYPLAWNAVLRQFSGFTTAKVILPVIDVDSELKQISPGKVDLDFAQDIKLQLPRIKVLDFANDALNEINGPINSVSDAIHSKLGAGFNTSGLTSGFRSLQDLMRENAEGFFRPVVESALTDPAANVVDKLYNALAAELTVSKANLLAKTPAIISATSNGLQTAIMNLNGTAGQANKLFGKLDHTLGNADKHPGFVPDVLHKDPAGKRQVVSAIIQKLAGDQGPALGFVASLGEDAINDLLREFDPTLTKIDKEMRQLRSEFSQVRTQVGAVGLDSDIDQALNLANHSTAMLQTYLQSAGGMSNLFSATVGPNRDYFTSDPARAKREIRERLTAAFLGSQMTAKYQAAFRQFLYDKNFLLSQLTDVLFDQLNRTIRNGLIRISPARRTVLPA